MPIGRSRSRIGILSLDRPLSWRPAKLAPRSSSRQHILKKSSIGLEDDAEAEVGAAE